MAETLRWPHQTEVLVSCQDAEIKCPVSSLEGADDLVDAKEHV
ncbi:MAG TPA: hypothetical protein VF618_08045 [Thermoanaerobaculia bacterium]